MLVYVQLFLIKRSVSRYIYRTVKEMMIKVVADQLYVTPLIISSNSSSHEYEYFFNEAAKTLNAKK